jgi:hypothetical protein
MQLLQLLVVGWKFSFWQAKWWRTIGGWQGQVLGATGAKGNTDPAFQS